MMVVEAGLLSSACASDIVDVRLFGETPKVMSMAESRQSGLDISDLLVSNCRLLLGEPAADVGDEASTTEGEPDNLRDQFFWRFARHI
jgi:hypothetical protein